MVSIIVPVYNAEKYLKACIKSILAQSYKDIELVLVNDGSKDGSLAIMQQFAKKDKRIVTIDKENEGSSITRKRGLDKATGEYVMFVDSDDKIALNTVESALSKMQAEDADVVCFGLCKFYKMLRKNFVFDFATVDNAEFMQNKYIGFFGQHVFPVQMCGKLYKKELFNGVEFDPIFMGDDLCVNIQLLPKAKRIACVAEPLYQYRFASGNTNRFNPRFLHEYETIKSYQEKAKQLHALNSHFSKMMYIESVNVFRTFCTSYLSSCNGLKQSDIDFIEKSYCETEFVQTAVEWFKAQNLEAMFENDAVYSERVSSFVKFNASEYAQNILAEIAIEKSSLNYKIKQLVKKFI